MKKKIRSLILIPSSSSLIFIDFQRTLLGIKQAPIVASFSGRGLNGLDPNILKPGMIAPGENILAGWIDTIGPTELDSDTRRTEFNIHSATSMACPHVSGVADLLMEYTRSECSPLS